MAKKAGKKANPIRGTVPDLGLLKQVYPTIAHWASGYGWVEFGIDERDRPFVRALDDGGTVWEGENRYETLDEALGAMEAGLGEFLEEEGFNKGLDGRSKRNQSTTPPEKGKPRKKAPPKAQDAPKRDDRVKPDAAPPVPRAIVEKVRKLAEIAEALRGGEHFQVTRLTNLKGLCKDPRAARSFAMFLADRARKGAEEKKATERVKELMDRAISGMESYMEGTTKGRKERLDDLLRELEREQDEYKQVSWGQVRVVHSMELVVIEKALKSFLRDHEAPTWLYQAARDHAERYDSRHGTGLIPASVPMVQEIADFWRDFYGLGR